MLTINNLKFARNEKEFISSLFEKDSTCYGYYKILKGRVRLLDMQGNIFACIYPNGIVNARKVNGKVFTQYGLADCYSKLLGVPEGYLDSIKYAESIYNQALAA